MQKKILYLIFTILLFAVIGSTVYFRVTGHNTPTPYKSKQVPTLVSSTASATPTPADTSIHHVFLIVMENRTYESIIGNSNAPYINSLASTYAYGQGYTGVAHPSLPNYIALIGGNTFGIASDCQTCFINEPNLADQLEEKGVSWKAYMDSMPSDCLIGNQYPYAQKHDPFIYYDDIRTNATRCRTHIVPLTQMPTDLSGTNPPQFVWITPNLCHDMHDCSTATGDSWLTTIIPQIMESKAYQDNGAIFITWDESSSDIGSNRVPLLVISKLAKQHFASTTPANHYSLLKTIETVFALPPLQHAAEANTLQEYFPGAL